MMLKPACSPSFSEAFRRATRLTELSRLGVIPNRPPAFVSSLFVSSLFVSSFAFNRFSFSTLLFLFGLFFLTDFALGHINHPDFQR